jgi:hypothetical protein
MNDSFKTLRRLIWLYFWLLLFEGAMRKWLFPGLSNALLIVRDPVVIAIYAVALRDHVFPRSGFVLWTALLAILCFLASFAGYGNLAVTVYGMRADFLHLPLYLLMPRVLQPRDVRRMGYAVLVLLVPMTLLAVKQFQAGTNSWWNVGAGGEVGGQLFAAQGKVRASGTFSFATGLATYLSLCAAYLLYNFLAGLNYPRWLTIAAGPALILTVVVSGSRTAVLSVAIVCILFLVIGLQRPSQVRAALWTVFLSLLVVGALAFTTSLFQEGMAVQRERFEGGGGLQNGILVRFAEDLLAARDALPHAPLLGVGLGVGTNVGANLLKGEREFILGEGEWQRVILESGPILGPCYILLRMAMLLGVINVAIKAHRAGRPLSLLLVGVGGLDLAMGQFGQPTTLGFAVFVAGLALAAARPEENSPVSGSMEPQAPPEEPLRGRSPYAERLHGGGDTVR